MIDRSGFVRILSPHESIVGRYDGQDYEFICGEPADVPKEVAAHIFGFGKENKVPALMRLGWVTDSGHIAAQMERLRRVRFSEAPALVEAPMEVEPETASASELMPDRTSSSRPLALGGDTGAAAPVAAPVEPSKGKTRDNK